MPRSALSLDLIDEPAPIANGVGMGVAALIDGIRERRRMDMMAQQQEQQRQREARLDAMAQDRVGMERERLQMERDRIDNMARDYEEKKKVKAEPKPIIGLKDARSLAIEQARAETGRDDLGNSKPIDAKRVEQLTDYIMQYGTVPVPELEAPGGGEELPVAVENTSDESKGLLARWWENTKEGADAIGSLFRRDSVAGTDDQDEVAGAVPGAQGAHISDSSSASAPMNDSFPTTDSGSYDTQLPPSLADMVRGSAPSQVNPNTPDPDPVYVEQFSKIAASQPDKAKKILSELARRSPAEYEALRAALGKARSKEPVVAKP